MEKWERDDGRYFYMNLERCLLGPAVVVYYGGQNVSRCVVYPVPSTEDGERMLDTLAARRRQHGYRLTLP